MVKQKICNTAELVKNSGVCALVQANGEDQQVALFYVPNSDEKVFAIGNWDPIGNANVMSRGLVGDIGNELVVASPLYKHHFSLRSGECIEEDASVPVYNVIVEGDYVYFTK